MCYIVDSKVNNFNLLQSGMRFATTDHCGRIQILDRSVVPEYLLYALHIQKTEEGFDRSFRASLANMRRFMVRIPVGPDGRFDVELQKRLARRFAQKTERMGALGIVKQELDDAFRRYTGGGSC